MADVGRPVRLSFPKGEHGDVLAQPGELTIGSAGDNHVVLQADGVLPHHASIIVDNRGFTLFVRGADAWTHVNARPVREKAILRMGDVVSLQSVNIVLKPDSDEIVVGDPPRSASGTTSEAQTPPKVVLRGVSGPYFGKVIAVQGQLTIGRGTDCDLVLDEPEMTKKHARIELGANDISLRDLGSSNGTTINGVQVRDAALYTGDQIAFDRNRFLIEAPGTPVRRNVPPEGSAFVAAAAAQSAPGPQPQVTQTMRAIRIDTPAPAAPVAATPEPAPQGSWNPWWLIAAGGLIAVGIALLLLGLR